MISGVIGGQGANILHPFLVFLHNHFFITCKVYTSMHDDKQENNQ